jgi:hypothetical protein
MADLERIHVYRNSTIGYWASRMTAVARPVLALSLLVLAAAAFAQAPSEQPEQPYVGRFLVYSGYMYLDSPHIGLVEPGFHIQAGMRYSRHISLGFDYSRGTGNTSIGLGLATTSLQNYVNQQLTQLIALGAVPASYKPALPLSSVTQTFAAGPEFPYRRFKRFTPYIRPSAGAINEVATARPADALTRILVKQIAPSGQEAEWTAFYGFGGGVALNVTKHFSVIVQGDFVHDHLFPDLLRDGRNTIRFSIGPGFQFGGNVTKKWGIPGHWE